MEVRISWDTRSMVERVKVCGVVMDVIGVVDFFVV